ncbi:MAG: YdcF family protein [Planctomycetes bacterium]|nr:YdcF family protein [Planctomycetota bacterium]
MTLEKKFCSNHVISRGFALFLSVFIILSGIGAIVFLGFSTLYWILNISFIPAYLTNIHLIFLGLFMFLFAINPYQQKVRKILFLSLIYVFVLFLLINIIEYYILLFQHRFHTKLPIPFTIILLLASCYLVQRIKKIKISKEKQSLHILKSIVRKLFFFLDFMPFHLHINVFVGNKTEKKIQKITKSITSNPSQLLSHRKQRNKTIVTLQILTVFVVTAFVFTLCQIFCFGKTNYRRNADAVVVFGALVHADGTMSLVLADRIHTACNLYKSGYTKYLICSGGPGVGKTTEAQAMRDYALKQGIPPDRIFVDNLGLNTFETVQNVKHNYRDCEIKSVLAVSHFYHLARIKLTFEKFGITAYTIPAYESRTPSALPFFITREVFALWYYFLKTTIY